MTQPTKETLLRIFAAYWGAEIEMDHYLRYKGYNIGYGELSPQDLVTLKIVKEI